MWGPLHGVSVSKWDDGGQPSVKCSLSKVRREPCWEHSGPGSAKELQHEDAVKLKIFELERGWAGLPLGIRGYQQDLSYKQGS